MPSEGGRTPADGSGPTDVARLAGLLAEVSGGARPTPVELAEVLWLAGHMTAPDTPAPTAHPPAANPRALPPREDAAPQPDPQPPTTTTGSEHDEGPDGRVLLHLPTTEGTEAENPQSGRLLHAPAPPMLTHPLALQRALRPLKRRVDAPVGKELDEEATAHRIAREGAGPGRWLPVLRPTTERWLTLHLVYDTGPTMPVWHPLTRELHTALTQSGIFRTVETHRLSSDGTVARKPYADGRSVTLLISDCMGPHWRESTAGTRWYRTLRHWATRMPVAVIQPLPERLWRTTALPVTTARLSAPWRAAPNSAYTVDSYATEDLPADVLPVPVLEASASWLANWAELVSSAASSELPGAVGLLTPSPPPAPVDEEGHGDVTGRSAEDLVLHFRSVASPEAFRLAGHLAVGRPELPVMRLVQAAVEPRPHPQHLAEIVLSGLLATAPGPPGSYAFRPGVRELLLRTLPRTARSRTTELLARVGAVIDARAGLAAGDFGVVAPGSGDATASEEPIAAVRGESVRRLGGGGGGEGASEGLLGGRYRLVGLRGPGRRIWRAVDERTGRTVVVHLYPRQPAPQERFLQEARALCEVESPHVVRVLDFGVEGDAPYLVAEFVAGVTLTELEAGSGTELPFRLLARLTHEGTAGLDALHERRLVRGQTGVNGLLLKPDDTFVISRFALGEESLGKDRNSDRAEFTRALQALVDRMRPPLEPRLIGLIRHGGLSEAALHAGTLLTGFRVPDIPPRWRDPLTFKMLGPVRIFLDDERLPEPPPEVRALICMLVLAKDRRLTFAELRRGLWGDELSEREALDRLHSLAAEIPQHLGPGTLAALRDGYALHTPDAFVDASQWEHLLASDAPYRHRTLIQQALALRYGDPLDGVPGPWAKSARAHLRTQYLALCAKRAEVDLELGDFDLAATDLEAVLQDHPDHPELRRLHIRAVEGQVKDRTTDSTSTPTTPMFSTIVFAADGLEEHPRAHDALGRAVADLLARADLDPHRYEVRPVSSGFVVDADFDFDAHPVLSAALREFPEVFTERPVPQLRVMFGRGEWFARSEEAALTPGELDVLADTHADIVFLISSDLYEELAEHVARTFTPLNRDRPGHEPVGWYRPQHIGRRNLIRGPFTTHDLTELYAAQSADTAIVHAGPQDGTLTLLNPSRPHGKRTSWPTITYYEVDLTVQHSATQVPLPSSGTGTFTADAEFSWHVDDPVAFVRSETTEVTAPLLAHLNTEGARITRRHPLRRLGAAQRALQTGLRGWPVPGLSVSCAVRLTVPGEQPPQQRSTQGPGPLTQLLAGAETVLLGFDGLLTDLYSRTAARAAARELLSFVDAERTLRDAAPETYVHPLDVLRAFAYDRPLAARMREHLDRLELRTVQRVVQTPYAASLIVALRISGRSVHVVTDVCDEAVHRHLERHRLTVTGVHGRGDDLRLLTPNPDCLLRALRSPGRPAPTGVLIGSSVPELEAARAVGLPFIGYAETLADRDRLRAAGCDAVVRDLMRLADAAASL